MTDTTQDTSTNQPDPAESQAYTQGDIIGTHCQINDAILILSRVDLHLVDALIEKTPAEFQDAISYKLLVLTSKYLKDVNEAARPPEKSSIIQ